MGQETKQTFCRICESLCGLDVTLENGKIIDIRPDNDHIATRGFACPKGLKQAALFDNPDRLKTPLKAVKPAPGLLLLFPPWLLHAVEPSGVDAERISVAFNAGVGARAA